MDGSDALTSDTVLKEMYETLKAKRPWFAWGRSVNALHKCNHIPAMAKLKNGEISIPTTAGFPLCFPIVFQAHMIKYLDAFEFQNTTTGNWNEGYEFVYKFVAIAGQDRILFMNTPEPTTTRVSIRTDLSAYFESSVPLSKSRRRS
jgi:hypothetical protein